MDRQWKSNIEELKHDVEENLEGSIDEFSDQLQDLKGILSETLGDLPFKFAILVIMAPFNLLYTFYQAFLATRVYDNTEIDCYCDHTDRVFYRTITLVFISFWVCFLFGYGVKSTFGHKHFTRYNKEKKNKRDSTVENDFLELLDMVTKQERIFEAQLSDLVSTRFLDDDYIKRIEQDCNNSTKSTQKNDDTACEIACSSASNVRIEIREKSINKKWYLFMCTKIFLILLRFILRLFIVPLLLLQWFNEYAWNCLMNNVIRNYCETEISKYYTVLDHNFLLYSVYVLLLIALLFSYIINWFPKGIPEITLQYKAAHSIDALNMFNNQLKFNIDKRGQFRNKMLDKRLNDAKDNATGASHA